MSINYVEIFMSNPEEYLHQYSSQSDNPFDVNSIAYILEDGEKYYIIQDNTGEYTKFIINQENCKKVVEKYDSITSKTRFRIISEIAIANAEYDIAVAKRKKAHSIMSEPTNIIKLAGMINELRLDIHSDILSFIKRFHDDKGCYFIPEDLNYLNIQTQRNARTISIYNSMQYRMNTSDFDEKLALLFNSYISDYNILPDPARSKIYTKHFYYIDFKQMLEYCNLHTY